MDAIEQLELRESQWGRIDVLLRRLLSRLTYAAEGRDAALDRVLGELRLAARDPMAEERIAPLLDDLADAVKSLDDAPAKAPRQPVPAAAPPATGSLLLALLDRLQLGESAAAELAELRRRIAASDDLQALREHGEVLAALINRQQQRLGEEKRVAEQLLQQVNSQLTVLTGFLDQDENAHQASAASRRQLDHHMLDAVQALDDRVRAAPDLASLQADVQARLEAVRAHLKAFREREEAREQAWQERAGRMRERILQLEHSALRMEVALEQKLRLVDTDPLTGLANRRALETRMAALCDPGADEASLLVLDIDHFKEINDRLGHDAGDRALRIVGEQMQAALRPGDFLARYGGEEFVAVLAATGAAEAMQVAERLRARIERAGFHSQNRPVRITLSCGVATVRPDDTPETVFRRADQALYRAKAAGRNRCEAL